MKGRHDLDKRSAAVKSPAAIHEAFNYAFKIHLKNWKVQLRDTIVRYVSETTPILY